LKNLVLDAKTWFAVIVIVAGILLFVLLANLVMAGYTEEIDESILLALRDMADGGELRGPHWVREAGRDLTALGGGAILFLLTFLISLYLLFQRKLHTVLLLIAAVLGGVLFTEILKALF
jgi:undecaprenyl-diphosphatase